MMPQGVEITGSLQPADYCINDKATCNNKCAAAHGPGFILVYSFVQRDKNAAKRAGLVGEHEWDKWFDEDSSRKWL